MINNNNYNPKTDIIEYLIKRGSDVNIPDARGITPFHSAVTFSYYEENPYVIKLLIDNGAKINVQDNDGWTPLHCAMRKLSFSSPKNDEYESRLEIVDYLVAKGADLNLRNKDGKTPLECMEHPDDRIIMRLQKYGVSFQ